MSIFQLFFDKRQPFFAPYHFLNTQLLKRKINQVNEPKQIFLLLTFDVENSWGDEENNDQEKNNIFLERIQKVNKSNKTFFIPGNLVSKLNTNLKQLANKNEIGLHGHHHELWRAAHFVKKRPVKDREKKHLIEKSLKEFDRNRLCRPVAFRAPYMWCKKSDLKLLERMQFRADSSDPSQFGSFLVRNNGKLTRIPITASPFPYFRKRRGMISIHFRLFNMKMVRGCDEKEFIEHINKILRLQVYLKQIPHLVFMAHSWEFYEEAEEAKDDNYYRSEANYEILGSKLDLLEKRYSVKYITIGELRKLFEKEKIKKDY